MNAVLHRVSECDVGHCVPLLLGQFKHILDDVDVIRHSRVLHLRVCVARLLGVLEYFRQIRVGAAGFDGEVGYGEL